MVAALPLLQQYESQKCNANRRTSSSPYFITQLWRAFTWRVFGEGGLVLILCKWSKWCVVCVFFAVAERDTWHVCGARCRVGSVTSAGVRLRINRVWFSAPQGPSLPGSLCKGRNTTSSQLGEIKRWPFAESGVRKKKEKKTQKNGSLWKAEASEQQQGWEFFIIFILKYKILCWNVCLCRFMSGSGR